MQPDVIVIGAGLAGLTAATKLVEIGLETIVLEARDRVGGRTYTQLTSNGVPIDLGGQWIGPTQKRIKALADLLNIKTFLSYDSGETVDYHNGNRTTYAGRVPTNDPSVTADVIEAILNLTMLANEVPLEAPWQADDALEWDSQTVATWLETNVSSSGAKNLLSMAVQAIFCAEPRDLSLLHFLFYIHSAGGLQNLIGVTGGAQESRFEKGAQEVSLQLAAKLGSRVKLNSPVTTIEHNQAGVKIYTNELTLEAKRAIIAIPPTLAGRLRYNPPLSGFRDQLTQRMPMGTVIKIHCVYERPFWREAGLSGQVTSDKGPLSVTFDNSPPSGTPGVMLGFVEGQAGRDWMRQSVEIRQKAVLDCLVTYFGGEAAHPLEYIEQNWAAEEYTRGCYAGYMPTGVWTSYGEALRTPIGCLHWAGTETATVWNGYMDGAVQSGERAALEVIQALEK